MTTEVAYLFIVDSLQNLLERMSDGFYTVRRLVLMSGDGGFRNIVNSLRSEVMEVSFIKPDIKMCAPLTSGAPSVNLSMCFDGKPNWHCASKSKGEMIEERKTAKTERKRLE